jgi:putative NIF3 family GTP cyclohydrolase 1 type 2
MSERVPLRLTLPAEGRGVGRVGMLAAPVARTELIERVKRELALGAMLVAGPREGEVAKVAVCAGAGRGLLDKAVRQKVDLYLTGEMPHHDALRAAAAGLTVVCALHSNSERAALRWLKERIEAGAPGIEVRISEADRDPFSVV